MNLRGDTRPSAPPAARPPIVLVVLGALGAAVFVVPLLALVVMAPRSSIGDVF